MYRQTDRQTDRQIDNVLSFRTTTNNHPTPIDRQNNQTYRHIHIYTIQTDRQTDRQTDNIQYSVI